MHLGSDPRPIKGPTMDIRRFMTAWRRCGPNTMEEKIRRQMDITSKLAIFKYVPYLQRPEVVRERS